MSDGNFFFLVTDGNFLFVYLKPYVTLLRKYVMVKQLEKTTSDFFIFYQKPKRYGYNFYSSLTNYKITILNKQFTIYVSNIYK